MQPNPFSHVNHISSSNISKRSHHTSSKISLGDTINLTKLAGLSSVITIIFRPTTTYLHVPIYVIHPKKITRFYFSLFRNKRFLLDDLTQQTTSKFAIFLEYEKPHSFFHFLFRATLFFSQMNTLVYVEMKNETKKNTWVFL